MSNPVERLAYNPNLIGEHMYAITEIEKNQPFSEAREELITDDPVLYKAGIIAVRGCQLVQEGSRRHAVATFDEGRNMLQENLGQELPLAQRVQYEQLDGALGLYRAWTRPFIRKSHREQQVLEARSVLQERTTAALGKFATLLQNKKNLKGQPTELATIAALERQMHPWLLATGALPHHDQGGQLRGRKNRNFDVLTTESVPGRQADHFRLQCKSDCLGLCQQFYTTMRYEAFEARDRARVRIRGAEDSIKEVSGCCDLGLWRIKKIRAETDPISLLAKEGRNEASAKEIAELDTLTSSLALTASLPSRITERNMEFPLSPLAKKDLARQKQEAEHRAAAEARLLLIEERRKAARAGMARIVGAKTKSC